MHRFLCIPSFASLLLGSLYGIVITFAPPAPPAKLSEFTLNAGDFIGAAVAAAAAAADAARVSVGARSRDKDRLCRHDIKLMG